MKNWPARIVENRGRGYASLEDLLLKTRLGERDLSALLAVSALHGLGRDGFSAREKQANWDKYLGFQPIELSEGYEVTKNIKVDPVETSNEKFQVPISMTQNESALILFFLLLVIRSYRFRLVLI